MKIEFTTSEMLLLRSTVVSQIALLSVDIQMKEDAAEKFCCQEHREALKSLLVKLTPI